MTIAKIRRGGSSRVASSTPRLWLVTFGVAAVLLFFFCMPLAFILYGGAGAVIGGAIILAPIILVQYLCLVLFRRLFPSAVRSEKK